MTDTLFLGTRTYSSWSMRIGLLVDRFDLNVGLEFVDFADPAGVAAQLNAAGLAPARTVPVMRFSDGQVIAESLAIAEELADRFPDAGLWPTVPRARAMARSLAAEMHVGFGPLRSACPMNLRHRYDGFTPAADVMEEVSRIERLWTIARDQSGGPGPWLCGDYSIADAFFAPIVARIVTYGLPIGAVGQAYIDAHLDDSAFRNWRAAGLAESTVLSWYEMDLPKLDWPA